MFFERKIFKCVSWKICFLEIWLVVTLIPQKFVYLSSRKFLKLFYSYLSIQLTYKLNCKLYEQIYFILQTFKLKKKKIFNGNSDFLDKNQYISVTLKKK